MTELDEQFAKLVAGIDLKEPTVFDCVGWPVPRMRMELASIETELANRNEKNGWRTETGRVLHYKRAALKLELNRRPAPLE